MIEHINQILTLTDNRKFYLQSVYNDASATGEPLAGNSYYVGCACADADDPTPLPGHQPGQVYETDGIASLQNAPAQLAAAF